ncbi:MAG: sigma-70 family RNA polymerase sigma factor, partial [Candidatus Hydrogenedentes bacterium]|nr:sigma-70 family RNA polymerase sigma factor [Candidatus Hydrogenedentota bacterium]
MNDQHLIQAWVSGRDPDAFKLLCDRYAGLVYATSLRVLRNGPDAEDISQECFVRLAQATNAFRAPLGAWLHRVTVNLCLDRIRSESSRRRREEHYGSQTSETVELTWDDLSVHIDAAINALPETLRETVLQHYMEGRTHQDIADREGVSRAAITQRTQRALALLRDNLKQRGIVAPLAVLSSLLPTGLAEATPIPATLAQRLSKLAMYSAATHSTSSGIAAWLLSVKGMASIATAAVLLGVVVLAWDRLGTQVSPEIDAALPVASATAPEGEQASTPPLEEVTPASAPLTPPPPAQAVAPDTGIVVTGVVREQETKRPLQNVKLVYQRDDGSQEFSYSDEDVLRTDAEGRYKITGLTPGTYKLLCIADWRTQDPGDVQEYPVTLRFAGNRSLQHFQVNETSEQTGPNFEAILGEAVSGNVLDAAGNPVAEANLQLQIMKSSVYVDATTDERGYFKVGGFPLSDQLYLAASKGRPSSVLMEANGEEKLVRPEPGVLVSGVLGPLVVSRGGLTGVEVIVQKGSSVAGRLLDERGAPLAKASVMARSNTQQFFGSRFDMTDDNGDFFFVGLPGAVYDLAWNRPDPKQPSDYPSWTPGEAEVLKRIEVDWDDHVQGLVLKVAAPAILEGGSITGMVRDTRGKPIGGATVQAIHNHESYESLSKTDGSFVVAQVPSGNCILRVSHPAYSPFYVSEEIAPAGATGLDIVLEDTGVLEGQVLSAETREPVPSFQIAARSWYGEAKLVNDEEGRFRLERVHSGVNAILTQAEGFAESQTELEVAPGATQEGIVVLLEQGSSIAGRVTTDEGLPVENAVIFHERVPQVPDQRDALALARTDGQGRFTLDHLDRPKGALAAWHDGFAPGIGYFDEGTSELLIELT